MQYCPKLPIAVSKRLSVWFAMHLIFMVPVAKGQQQGIQPAQGQTLQQAVEQAVQENGGKPVQVMSPEQARAAGIAQLQGERPFPPLQPQEQAYLDQVLSVWQQRTEGIARYECDIKRWEYALDANPESISAGVLKYSSPDKGLFRLDKVESIVQRGADPKYQADPRNPHGEYWICDGNWVHILDRNEKKATRIELPPQLRGQQIYLSPLPFLFGVKADEMKRRYWIRPVAPPQGSQDTWLEAFPRRPDDAGNYSRVQVVLDKNDILPKALIVFLPNWSAQKQYREIYEFSNRVTGETLLNKVAESLFLKQFISTKVPSDWKVVEEPYIPSQDATNQGQGSPAQSPGRVAQQPQPGPAR